MSIRKYKHLENIDLVEYFGMIKQSLKLDNTKWKIEDIVKDVEEGFTKIKCSFCNDNAIKINQVEKTCYCNYHAIGLSSSDGNIVQIDRLLDDFKDKLRRMEKYFIYFQVRHQYLSNDKVIGLMSIKNKDEIKEQINILERKINEFNSKVDSLKKSKDVHFLFEIKDSYNEMKDTIFDIYKIISSILYEHILESCYNAIKEDLKLSSDDNKSEEESKAHNIYSIENLYNKVVDILAADFIPANKVFNFQSEVQELYKYTKDLHASNKKNKKVNISKER